MTSLLTPEETTEVLSVLEAGGLLRDDTFTSVAIAAVPELRDERSTAEHPRIAATADLAMVAAHGDPKLLAKWLLAARTRLVGDDALVARLTAVIRRVDDTVPLPPDPIEMAKIADRLSDLFPREADQRTFVDHAGLDAKRIAFDPVAQNSWRAIVKHAIDIGALERVLATAHDAFPEDPTFVERMIRKDAPIEKKEDEKRPPDLPARPRTEDRAALLDSQTPGLAQRRRPIG
jgi:hypothetical protein